MCSYEVDKLAGKKGLRSHYFLGMWYAILEFLNLVGVVTNAFLIAFTSQYGRKWEGQALVTNSTQTLIDRVTNVTTLVQTVTQQPASRNRLWIVIIFEVGITSIREREGGGSNLNPNDVLRSI